MCAKPNLNYCDTHTNIYMYICVCVLFWYVLCVLPLQSTTFPRHSVGSAGQITNYSLVCIAFSAHLFSSTASILTLNCQRIVYSLYPLLNPLSVCHMILLLLLLSCPTMLPRPICPSLWQFVSASAIDTFNP